MTANMEGQRARIAEALDNPLFAIYKPSRGGYYGVGVRGYWSSIGQAWHLPKEEAQKYTMYADSKPGDNAYHERVILEQVPAPDYFTDANAALSICEFMRGKGFEYVISSRLSGGVICSFIDGGKCGPCKEADTLPAAICAAFCAYLDGREG